MSAENIKSQIDIVPPGLIGPKIRSQKLRLSVGSLSLTASVGDQEAQRDWDEFSQGVKASSVY
jgi:hypothetical protein